MPVKYKKAIMMRLNRLIQAKGTDTIFVDILNIFDYEGISIIAYHLVKHKSDNGQECLNCAENDLRFIGRDVSYSSLHEAVKVGDYRVHSFDEVTGNDPTWLATKAEVSTVDFEEVRSKYFSIESHFDLMKNTLDTAFLTNLIRSVKRDLPVLDDMSLYASAISKQAIDLGDLLLAAQILITDYYGVEDEIPTSGAIGKIYSFDLKDDDALNGVLIQNVDPANPSFGQGPRYLLDDVTTLGQFGQDELLSVYSSDRQKYENYAALLRTKLATHWTTPATGAALQRLYAAKFTADYVSSQYNGFSTYTDFIRSLNADLAAYVEQVKNYTDMKVKQERILYVLDALTEYVFETGVRLDRLFSDVIASYVIRLVNVFKSYTTTLRDFLVVYVWRENLFFKFSERANTLGTFDAVDRPAFGEGIEPFTVFTDKEEVMDPYEKVFFFKENFWTDRTKLDDRVKAEIPYGNLIKDFAPTDDKADFAPDLDFTDGKVFAEETAVIQGLELREADVLGNLPEKSVSSSVVRRQENLAFTDSFVIEVIEEPAV
jgi:hypothetical protein